MADPSYQPKVYHEQSGDRLVAASGGSIDVESGGEIDIESGGALKIAAVAVTASAAELNAVDGVTLGVAVPTKAVVLDASKNYTGINNLTLIGYRAGPVNIASTNANSAFEGVLEVSSTNSTGAGVYLLSAPAAAGIVMDVVCLTTTGGVTLSTTTATIVMSTNSGNTMTFAKVGAVRLIAQANANIFAIPSSTSAATVA